MELLEPPLHKCVPIIILVFWGRSYCPIHVVTFCEVIVVSRKGISNISTHYKQMRNSIFGGLSSVT